VRDQIKTYGNLPPMASSNQQQQLKYKKLDIKGHDSLFVGLLHLIQVLEVLPF
jgi:hypothetical protein